MVSSPWFMHSSRSVRVTGGGKEQSFKVMLFAGNEAGFGGYAIGRGPSVIDAQEIAWKRLMNSMMFLPRNKGRTLFHDSDGQFNQIKVKLRLRREGSGLCGVLWRRFVLCCAVLCTGSDSAVVWFGGGGAGNKACNFGMIVLNGFGLQDVSMNILGGKNPYSWMHAIFDALGQQVSNKAVAQARGQRSVTHPSASLPACLPACLPDCPLPAACCVRACSLYREVDYNDIPVPAPDEPEWEAQTERVRDAVIDQVYINPITYPERFASAEELKTGLPPWSGQLPSRGFAKPWHQVHVRGDGVPQWPTPGLYSKRYKQWMGKRGEWSLAAVSSAERATNESVARNLK
jgi:ribosomal protein S5